MRLHPSSFRWVLVGIATCSAFWSAHAQTLPFEYRDSAGTPNLQSVRGVPISRTVGVPPGSDGRGPAGNESTGIPVPATPGQFRGLLVVGGTPGLTSARWTAVKAAG